MKKLSILALSATIITAPVFAETTTYPTPSVELSTQFNEATDLSFAFDDTQNLQATVMTDSQMQETQGAWVANAVGGLAGMYGAGYGYLAGGGNDPYKFIGAAAMGGGSSWFCKSSKWCSFGANFSWGKFCFYLCSN